MMMMMMKKRRKELHHLLSTITAGLVACLFVRANLVMLLSVTPFVRDLGCTFSTAVCPGSFFLITMLISNFGFFHFLCTIPDIGVNVDLDTRIQTESYCQSWLRGPMISSSKNGGHSFESHKPHDGSRSGPLAQAKDPNLTCSSSLARCFMDLQIAGFPCPCL